MTGIIKLLPRFGSTSVPSHAGLERLPLAWAAPTRMSIGATKFRRGMITKMAPILMTVELYLDPTLQSPRIWPPMVPTSAMTPPMTAIKAEKMRVEMAEKKAAEGAPGPVGA